MSHEPLHDLDALRALCEAAMAPGPFSRLMARQLGAAALVLVERREKNRSGIAPATPTTPDGQLVAAACLALGVRRGRPFTRGELADKLGLGRANQSMLGPVRLAQHGLSDEHAAQLRAWIAAAR